MLKKKEMEKHQKLVKSERKYVELGQEKEAPVGKDEEMMAEL